MDALLSTPQIGVMEKVAWTSLWVVLIVAITATFLVMQQRRTESFDGEAEPSEMGVIMVSVAVTLAVALISVGAPYSLHHAVVDLLGVVYSGATRIK